MLRDFYRLFLAEKRIAGALFQKLRRATLMKFVPYFLGWLLLGLKFSNLRLNF